MAPSKAEYFSFPVFILENMIDEPLRAFNEISDFAIVEKMDAYCSESEEYRDVSEKEKYESACSYFCIIPKGSSRSCIIETGRRLQRQLKSQPSKIFTQIRIDTYWEYHKSIESKTEFDLAQLCTYLSIKSIVGKKEFIKTNKKLLLSRAFGTDQPYSEKRHYHHYFTRYHWERLRDALELNWGVRVFSDHNRGFYLSTKVDYDRLAEICVSNKKKYKLQELRKQKSDAMKRAKANNMKTARNEPEPQQHNNMNHSTKYNTLNKVFNEGF